MIKGLSLKTERVFLALSELEFINDYILVGGTALSLQLQTRLSEDLDFMKWKRTKNERTELPWNVIEHHLACLDLGKVKTDILDFNQVLFEIAGVKLSFYFRDSYPPEGIKAIPFMGSIKIADVFSIGVMKIDAMLRRSAFRDYYDLYSILKDGADLGQLIDKASKYSGHTTKTRTIISMISNGSRFFADDRFNALKPVYNISGEEIEDFIKKETEKKKENIFTEREIPVEDFSKLGLVFSDISQEDKQLLLKGEIANTPPFRISLKRNPDNSVSIICHSKTNTNKIN